MRISDWSSDVCSSDLLDKLSEVLGAAHEGEFYRQFVSYWKDPAQAVIGAELPPTRFDEPSSLGLFERMMLLDALTYLPDDILVKVDRAATAAMIGRHARRERMVQYAWSSGVSD